MAKPKNKWPKLPAYCVPLFNSAWVYLCVSRDEWHQACAHLNDSSNIDMLGGACKHYQNTETGENMYLLGVFNNDIATLVHECAHATFYCCNDVGVTVSTSEANETYCYMLDRMFSYFLPYIKSGE